MTKDIKLNECEFKIIKDSKDEPNLEQAQEFVGGMVEGITFPNGDYLIINEEGKLMGLPLNSEATMMWRATFTKDKYAFGYDDFELRLFYFFFSHNLSYNILVILSSVFFCKMILPFFCVFDHSH